MCGSANHAAQLRAMILSRSATIGIVGLGYVGLPLALAFAEKGFRVLGFDVDDTKVRAIDEGRDYIRHIGEGRVGASVREGRLSATSALDRLGEPDVIVICVPTPLTQHREPDMTYVEGTTKAIATKLRPGQLVILESTTYPGTTEELVRSTLEKTGLLAGHDFFLAYSPEREDPGNQSFGTKTIPKLVGGFDELSGDLAQLFYDQAVERTVRVSSPRVAEAAKLTENIFRAINIALVNELKVVYDRMGIDVWEVLDAASTKPFGFMRFNPGPGWGGHCIPLDPFYLSWKARAFGVSARFIELAGEINVLMPEFVVQKLQRGLNDRGLALKNSRILVLGLAYKKDIDDPRESPAFEVIDHLLHLGAQVAYHDPHIPEAPRMRTWPAIGTMRSTALSPETVREHDAVIIITDHSAVDYAMVGREAKVLVDTRGVVRGGGANVVKA